MRMLSEDELRLHALERRWAAYKALLAIMIGIWVGVNLLWLVMAIRTGTGLWWTSSTMPDGNAPGLSPAVHHNDGFLPDATRLAAFVVADVTILGFWFWLMDRLGDAEHDA